MNRRDLSLLSLSLATLHVPYTVNASDQATLQRPNILLILVDDLGLGDLSCQYAADLQTPHIDALFTSGLRLDNCYANSNVSSPSRAALLTGCFPATVGVPGVIRTHPKGNWGNFDPEVPTLPEILARHGYHTALIGKWHLGLESPNLPNERGFDLFQGFLGDMMDDYYTHLRHGDNYMYRNQKQIAPRGHATELFTQWAVDYIREQAAKEDPFFLFLSYNAPHTPLQPPAEWLKNAIKRHPDMPQKRQRLIALIEHLDDNIGQVINQLEKTSQRENTLIIFTSDNGGDRGCMANNGPTRGAKGDMFEGGLRVACAINQPGRFDGGRHDNHFTMLMDLFPTLCDLLRIKITHPINGISVLKAWTRGHQRTNKRYVFWLRHEGGHNFAHGESPQTAVRYGNDKLLRNLPTETPQRFDLQGDPQETIPLPLVGGTYMRLDKALTKHMRQYEIIRKHLPLN